MPHTSTVNRTTKVILTLCGIWPGAWCVIICRAYWIIALAADEFCHCRYFSLHWHTDDLSDLTDCFSSFIAQLKLITKLSVFWLNQRKFIKILSMMTEDWRDCAESDVGMRETTCKAKLSGRITNAMVTLHALAILAYSGGMILAYVDINDESAPPLLLKVEVPIDIHSQLRYKVLVTMQFVYLLIAGCGTGLVNALLLTLILHVGGQMDILRCWLTELVPRENEPRNHHESIIIMTNKIIRKHQKIIIFSEHIEDLYTYIALVQFALNTLLMCGLGFLAINSISSSEAAGIGKSVLFYTVTTLEAFIFCFAGEYLKNKSKEVGTAAYDCAWYELKPENSRTLILVILRAQKQLTLTAGKIMDLSLESFTSIMKASASYMSVMFAMQ